MAIELPEHLRTGPMAEAAQRALADAQSMAASSNSVPRISLKGREFRFVEGGEELYKFRDFIDVIILGVEPEPGRMIKTYYKDGYKSGAKEPPTCASDDGIAPGNWVNEKQATHCATCDKNRFGSATSPSGKPTKACRDSKRIWIKMADGMQIMTPQGPVPCPESTKEFKDRTLYGMGVTVASLKAFAEFGRELSAIGQPPAVCVTRIKMLDMEFPQVEFELHAWLSVVQAPLSLKMAEDRPWKIKYANAGLALAGPDGPNRPGLPGALPGQRPSENVPDHLRNMTQANTPPAPPPGQKWEGSSQAVSDAVPASAKPVGDLDKSIASW